MPRQRHGRRHSVVAYDTGVKPPKPGVSRYGLIDFTLPIPSPARPYPLSAMRELLCAVGVVPTRVYPKSGRISALAGRQGRLRACMRTSSEKTDSDDDVVTTFIIKSDSVPARRAGRGRFSVMREGLCGFSSALDRGFSGGCLCVL